MTCLLDNDLLMLGKTKPPAKASNTREKRKYEDNIPQPVSGELRTESKSFSQLDIALKCEAHKGHCFVARSSGQDNHRRLSLKDMTLWAQKMVSDYFLRKTNVLTLI